MDEHQSKAKRSNREAVYKSTGSRYRLSSFKVFRVKYNFFNYVHDAVLHAHVWSHHAYSLRPDQHIVL